MIRVTSTGLHVSVSGPVVYLDNWAFIELAEKEPLRRRRFVEALHSGIDLLFSVTNAAELTGPQGKSSEVLKEFLNEIGPHWFPARLDATEAVKLEIRGETPEKVCIDEKFFKSYVADQMRSFGTSDGRIIQISDDLFRLGPLLDRLACQRESIVETSAAFDEVIKEKMSGVRARCKRDATYLDRKFPVISFNSRRRASFVYLNLLRQMAIEPNFLKKGDGMDFCHAVIACAFSSFVALDKHWKRRIAKLPPNQLPRIYSHRELDQMVTDMELWLSAHAA